MPIQFHCPHCSAPIRVADAAAGKKGRCPQCGTELIVPRVGPAATPVPPGSAAVGDVADPAGGFPVIEPQRSAGSASVLRTPRRRRRRTGLKWVWPVVFFGLIVGVVSLLIWQSRPTLEGTLSATRLPDFDIPPQLVDRASVDRPADEVTAVLGRLKRKPIPRAVTRDWMALRVEPAEGGLTVQVERTDTTEVFRVTPLADPGLRAFIHEQAGSLSALRTGALRRGATDFFKALAAAQKSGSPFETSEWRHELAIPAVTGAFGYVVEADTGGRAYPCIHEDSQGRLYFLLPRNTNSFTLRGRVLPDGSKPFPGSYIVRVDADAPAPAPPETAPMDTATDAETTGTETM